MYNVIIEIGEKLKIEKNSQSNNPSHQLGTICLRGNFYEKHSYSIENHRKYVLPVSSLSLQALLPRNGRTTFMWDELADLRNTLRNFSPSNDIMFSELGKVYMVLESVNDEDVVVFDYNETSPSITSSKTDIIKHSVTVDALTDLKLGHSLDDNLLNHTIGEINIGNIKISPLDYSITGISSNTNFLIMDVISELTNKKEAILYHDVPLIIDKAREKYYELKFYKNVNQKVLDELISFIFQLQYVKSTGAILIKYKGN